MCTGDALKGNERSVCGFVRIQRHFGGSVEDSVHVDVRMMDVLMMDGSSGLRALCVLCAVCVCALGSSTVSPPYNGNSCLYYNPLE